MRYSSWRRVLAITGALVWAQIILGLYYWVHRPFGAALADALGGAVLDAATAALFVIIGGGVGRRLLRRVDLTGWSNGEHAAAQAVVGLAALSMGMFAVGLAALNPLSIGALLTGAAALAGRDTLRWLGDLAACVRVGLPAGRWPRFVALVVVILAAMALVMSLLPPTQWDTLTYHLYGPARYVDHGRFFRVPHVHFLGFPQLVETLYTGQIALTGRLTASAALHWATGMLMLLMTGGFTARHAGRAAGWVAASTLVVAYTVWLEMFEAYVDLMLMALAAIMLAVTERWLSALRDARSGTARPQTDTRLLVLLGVLAGWAMGTKYTAIWLAISFGVLILWLSRGDGWQPALARGAIYTAAAAVVLLPWLVRNVVWYHSPVYPLFFPAGDMDTLRLDWYAAPGTGLVPTGQAWHIPLLPITATVFGVEGSTVYQADIGPLFGFLVPLLLIVWRHISEAERALLRRVLIVVGVSVLAWMVTAAFGSFYNIQTRLVFFLLPLWAVMAGIAVAGLQHLPVKPLDLGFMLRACVTLVLALTLIRYGHELVTSGVHAYFSGESDHRKAYLDHALGWTHAAMEQINALEPGTEVRFLWEPRGLYCDEDRIDCRVDSALDAWYYARHSIGDGNPAAIADAWRADGADMLLVFEAGRVFEVDNNDRYSQADWETWAQFTRDQLVEVWRGGSEDDPVYILYRWRSPAQP